MLFWICKGLSLDSTGVGNYENSLFRELSVHSRISPIEYRDPGLPFLSETIGQDLCHPLRIIREIPPGKAVHITGQSMAHYINLLSGRNPRNVLTVHDIYSVLWRTGWPLSLLQSRLVLSGIRKAGRIIAVSEFTREQLATRLGISLDRISVVYNGVDHQRFFPAKRKGESRELELLYVGASAPWKNLPVLIKALSILKSNGVDFRFTKVGSDWGGPGLRELVRKHGLQKMVRFAGRVPSSELPGYYQRADAFIFPSIYEGFGLPCLEAMACGCPVIASGAASLPEVVGDAGILADPHDPSSFASSIKMLAEDFSLRKELSRRGINRAGEFSWKRCARETREVYSEF